MEHVKLYTTHEDKIRNYCKFGKAIFQQSALTDLKFITWHVSYVYKLVTLLAHPTF